MTHKLEKKSTKNRNNRPKGPVLFFNFRFLGCGIFKFGPQFSDFVLTYHFPQCICFPAHFQQTGQPYNGVCLFFLFAFPMMTKVRPLDGSGFSVSMLRYCFTFLPLAAWKVFSVLPCRCVADPNVCVHWRSPPFNRCNTTQTTCFVQLKGMRAL